MAAEFEYSERRSFWQRWGLILGLGAAGVTGVYVILSLSKGGNTTARLPTNDIVMVRPVPPPPPPPIPQQPQPKPEPATTPRDAMVEQTPVQEEAKPEENPSPPESLGTGITGSGGVDMGLSSSGNGGRIGGAGSGAGGSRFGWYAAKLQRSIRDALSRDPRTRAANFSARKISVQLDATGRITAVQLGDPTGDRALDAAIREVLVGIQLEESRPEGMPASVHLRISAARPAS